MLLGISCGSVFRCHSLLLARSGRYSALIRDNKILTAHVADDGAHCRSLGWISVSRSQHYSGGGMPVTLANVILDDIKAGAAKEHT